MTHDTSTGHAGMDGNWRTAASHAAVAVVSLMLLYTMAVWAGTRPSLHLGCVALSGALALVVVAGVPAGALARDPVLWLGLLFLALVAAAAGNAGRTLYFDVGLKVWRHTPPPQAWGPSAFARRDALEALGWFAPALPLALALRSPLFGRGLLRGLLAGIGSGAAALALFGLGQFLSGTHRIYGAVPLSVDFFASFAYSNHAAAFFLLAAGLAAGFLIDALPARGGARRGWHAAAWSAALALDLAGACLSLSRAGVILAALLAVAVLGHVARRSDLPGRRALLPCAAALLVAAGGVAALGWKGIRREFTAAHASPLLGRLNLSLSGRPHFLRAAWAIWRDHRAWGIGPGGFAHAVAGYLPADRQADLRKPGWANVHCDPLHFLVEYGAVGGALLAALAAALAFPGRCLPELRDPVALFGACGLGLVLLFSLFDLPFRCPAILYTWLTVLVALPRRGRCAAGGTP